MAGKMTEQGYVSEPDLYVSEGQYAAGDVLMLNAALDELVRLREGRYAPPGNPRPLRDFVGVLPPLPEGELAEDYLDRLAGE